MASHIVQLYFVLHEFPKFTQYTYKENAENGSRTIILAQNWHGFYKNWLFEV